MKDYTIEELERMAFDGQVDVKCSGCNETFTVETDCDDPCICGKGRIVSPLVELGYI